jgi:hypothetical protein
MTLNVKDKQAALDIELAVKELIRGNASISKQSGGLPSGMLKVP